MRIRGRVPSLITSNSGACKIVQAKRRRSCKRCQGNIEKGSSCAEVNVPSQMGYKKTYCTQCFYEILKKTRSDIDKLATDLGLAT
jgi:hypothetical protein